ncbi:MAG: hypothetical protein IH614_13615, partial [Desulfuromonadales bacterium]|nr:hypothetical protein [Desulfuromonadales bacterium]
SAPGRGDLERMYCQVDHMEGEIRFALIKQKLIGRAAANRLDFEQRYGLDLDRIIEQAALATDRRLGL